MSLLNHKNYLSLAERKTIGLFSLAILLGGLFLFFGQDKHDVSIDKGEWISVEIQGAVEQPGIYYLKKDAQLIHLLEKARPTQQANLKTMNLAEPLKANQKYQIPSLK